MKKTYDTEDNNSTHLNVDTNNLSQQYAFDEHSHESEASVILLNEFRFQDHNYPNQS